MHIVTPSSERTLDYKREILLKTVSLLNSHLVTYREKNNVVRVPMIDDILCQVVNDRVIFLQMTKVIN